VAKELGKDPQDPDVQRIYLAVYKSFMEVLLCLLGWFSLAILITRAVLVAPVFVTGLKVMRTEKLYSSKISVFFSFIKLELKRLSNN
jgi:hypothetical protein